jgi:cob(I)alamin adenosyltransferase
MCHARHVSCVKFGVTLKAKIYTKTGDTGQTALVGGRRVPKTDPRLDAYGTVDELNSCIGLAIAHLESSSPHIGLLQKIQNELFNLGSRLACDDLKLLSVLPGITDAQIHDLEIKMDEWESSLEKLKEFILPGGSTPAAALHLARTICRRAERLTLGIPEGVEPIVVIYLNRLSDFLFTHARKINADLGVKDVTWKK